jgi:molybdopterin/thiamine biosynthesis adenylyltransferase
MSKYKNQTDIIDPKLLNKPIHILGVGGVGSFTAMLLAKMGCNNINVYDDDIVEEHNVVSQFFTTLDLGLSKVDALQKNVNDHADIVINKYPTAIEENINNGLVIIAVDKMKRRAELATLYKDKNIFIIDGRMGGMQLEIYCYHAANYPSTIISENMVSPDLCTAKSICFNTAMIASYICNFVRLYCKSELKEGRLLFNFNTLDQLKNMPL